MNTKDKVTLYSVVRLQHGLYTRRITVLDYYRLLAESTKTINDTLRGSND